MRVVGDGVISDWIWISFGTVVAKPPLHVVHVIWPTVNVRPSGTVAEAGIVTPYLARHCRRKLVGSLPWGIPRVVVYR